MLRQRRRVVDVAEDGRLDVVSAASSPPIRLPPINSSPEPSATAASTTSRMRSASASLITGPKKTVGSNGSPTRGRPDGARNFSSERVVHRLVDQDPARARAALAGLHQRSLMGRHRRGGIEIGVVEHDVGGLAAQFGDHRRQVGRGGGEHPTRGRLAAGEVDLADAGMADERLPALRRRRARR